MLCAEVLPHFARGMFPVTVVSWFQPLRQRGHIHVPALRLQRASQRVYQRTATAAYIRQYFPPWKPTARPLHIALQVAQALDGLHAQPGPL
jgi:hypothetical protein